MRISLGSLRSASWFAVAVLIAMSFPLQVYAGSPMPSLLPYGVIALLLLIQWMYGPARSAGTPAATRSTTTGILVGVYVTAVVVVTAWQGAFGLIDAGSAASALIVFALPVSVYWYFRRRASTSEIRAFMIGIAVAGVIAGLFFAYDSYLKIGLGRVSDYSRAAFEYTIARSGESEAEANPVRILPWYRSFGLMERHTVSAAWIVLGAFGALALLGERRRAARRAVMLAAAGMLLVGLNFTIIVAFVMIAFLLEFDGVRLLRGRLSVRMVVNVLSLAAVVVGVFAIVLLVAGDGMGTFLVTNLLMQRDLALGSSDAERSYMRVIVEYIQAYGAHLDRRPLTMIFGDGYATYGSPKGGDIGVVETLARLGVPLFLLLGAGTAVLIVTQLRRLASWFARPSAGAQTGEPSIDDRRVVAFSAAVLMLVAFSEIHYSIWGAKAILPILFFAVALCDRRGRMIAVPTRD